MNPFFFRKPTDSIELYDYRSQEKESKNVVENDPELCEELKQLILKELEKQKSH